jgi:lipoate-protein ligase A
MMGQHTTTVWKWLMVPARSGAENMARDTALMDRARQTGESVFSIYEWERPTLSLGRNQTARGRYDLGAAEAQGIDVVRRPTGGRALMHHREVTYSVTAPIADDESLHDSYHRINRLLLDGLRRLGVSASEAPVIERTPQPGTLPCFATPAQGELVADGGKLVGSAQLRQNGALLQHGSILIADDQPLIGGLLLDRADTVSVPAASTLTAALGKAPSVQDVASAIRESLESLEMTETVAMHEEELEQLTARHRERYRSEWWTWRR